MKTTQNFETLQQHAGQQVDQDTRSRAVPLYQTASYTFENSDHAAALFNGEAMGNIYSRIMNPTVDVFEKRMAALEGGSAALAVSSGHAAQHIALTTFLKAGDNFVASPYLYGGSYNQFDVSFDRIGIECRFAEDITVEALEAKIDDNTKAIYVESIGNPGFRIPDFKAIAALAQKHNIPFVVDNTFGAGGYLVRPIEHGANIVVESATKWIGGHGTSIGGIIVDGGNFDWANGKFPEFTGESKSGTNWSEAFEGCAFALKARCESLRDTGSCLSPFNAFMFIQGLETLSLRVDRHIENTRTLVKYFSKHKEVEVVNYPELPENIDNKLAQKYLPKGAGAVITIQLKKGIEAGKKVIDSLELVSHLANVGDSKTLIIQPAATTHQQLTDAEQAAVGLHPSQLRISVGLEHFDDIVADFEQAFAQI